MNYKTLAEDIMKQVGGVKNINHVTHCSTRLRFTLVDDSIVDLEVIKKIQGVLGAVNKAGQIQIIIGNEVEKAYNEVLALGNFNTNKDIKSTVKKRRIDIIIDTIVGIFSPTIPAITGAGMLKSVLSILTISKLVSKDSQTYYIIDFISDAIFYFLPMLLAVSSAKKFKCNIYIALGLAGVLLHPNWNSLVAAGNSVVFFGIPVTLFKYASSAIPIILIIWFMSYVEAFAEKVSPSVIKFILKPLIILLVTAPIALIIIGPIGAFLGNLIVTVLNFLDSKAGFLVPTLMGTFMPLMVSIGVHMSFTPVAAMSLSENGYDRFSGPGMLASNIAQSGAAFAVAFKTKNKSLKQIATSSGVTALFGITEPALYGVTLKLKKPLIAVMIAGGVAGFYAGITGVIRVAFSSPGLAALPTYITENPKNLINAIITMVIAFIISFIMTLVLGFDDSKEEGNIETQEAKLLNKKIELQSIGNGKLIALRDVNDETFANEMLGKGVGFKLDGDEIYSPVDGEIVTIFPTKHAIGLKTEEGLELLIHIGIDTVNLNGKYFEVKVKAGDKVKAGQLLAEFQQKEIKKEGYDTTVLLIITNCDNFDTSKISYTSFGDINTKQTVLTIN